VLGAALVAALLSTFFFAPRFVVWRAFGVPELGYNIEIFRSPRFLHQIEQPFDRITVASDQVIQWRLLFPLLAHWLHLPVPVVWVLPWVGCLLALATAAQLLWTHTRDVRLVWLGTLLTATCSWYFVATGWVFYFDGWLLAAMLLAAFARSRRLLLAAALLAPWIDERFILALPLCLAVRWTQLSRDGQYRWRDWLVDTGWLSAGVTPYLGLRVWAWSAGVWQPEQSYLVNTIGFTSPAAVSLEGMWFGLRAAWLPALLWPVLVWRRGARGAGAGALLVLLASVVFHVGMAGDVSRSASVAVPALLAGVMAWRDWPARWASCLLIAAGAANLLLPARHVVTSNPVSRIPIFYLHTELAQLSQPPDQFNPKAYNALGVQAMQAQKIQEAYHAFTTALGLDPGYAPALVNRGVLLYNHQQKAPALADFDRAVALDPQLWDARFSRAIALSDSGAPAKAAVDLEYLLDHAPADWPNLAQARAALAALRARGLSP
jgi:hypothetical protein